MRSANDIRCPGVMRRYSSSVSRLSIFGIVFGGDGLARYTLSYHSQRESKAASLIAETSRDGGRLKIGKLLMSTSPPLASHLALYPAAAAFTPRLFTVDEYHRLGELGVLTEEDRVELLEGVITPKMVHNPPHDGTLSVLEHALRQLLPNGWFIRVQLPITTSDSEPEPDIAVVRGTGRDYMRRHPGPADVGLVVEVADSSLARDRKKTRLYARAAVAIYWIVNLVDAQIEVHSQPTGPADHPAYQQKAIYRRGDRVPFVLPGMTDQQLSVKDLLP